MLKGLCRDAAEIDKMLVLENSSGEVLHFVSKSLRRTFLSGAGFGTFDDQQQR